MLKLNYRTIIISLCFLLYSQVFAQPFGPVGPSLALPNGIPISAPILEKSISLSGQGIVYVEPDVAIMDLGIRTTNLNIDEAITEANTIIDAVQTALIDLGIEKRHIRTGQFDIYPQPRYNNFGRLIEVEYQANHILTVTVEDITLVGVVLGEGLDKGANLSGSIIYTLSDAEAVENEARAMAIASIEKKLQQYVDLMGISSGKIVQFNESSNVSNSIGPQGRVMPVGAPGFNIPVGPVGPMGPVGPVGAAGANGGPGPVGPMGPVGPVGAPGRNSAAGPQGPAGISCFDLNRNGVGDANEDRNGDGRVDSLDCNGAPGAPGRYGAAGPQGPVGPASTYGVIQAPNSPNSAAITQASVPVSPGQIAIQVDLYISYEIEQ